MNAYSHIALAYTCIYHVYIPKTHLIKNPLQTTRKWYENKVGMKAPYAIPLQKMVKKKDKDDYTTSVALHIFATDIV